MCSCTLDNMSCNLGVNHYSVHFFLLNQKSDDPSHLPKQTCL